MAALFASEKLVCLFDIGRLLGRFIYRLAVGLFTVFLFDRFRLRSCRKARLCFCAVHISLLIIRRR